MWRRALIYVGIVFGVGFALGAIRVTLLVPRLGERWAELLEMPLMLVAIFYAARFVVRRHPGVTPAGQLQGGLLALAMMLAVELGIALPMRGLTLAEYLATRDPVSGTAYAASLVVFALMPWVLARRARTFLLEHPDERPSTR